MPEHVNPVDPPDLGLLPTFRRLLRLWWGERRLGFVGLGFALVYTLISTTIPLLLQRAIDHAVVRHTERLWPYLLAIVGLAILAAAAPAWLALDRRLAAELESRARDDLMLAPRVLVDRMAANSDALMMRAKDAAHTPGLSEALTSGNRATALRLVAGALAGAGLSAEPLLVGPDGGVWNGPPLPDSLVAATRADRVPVVFVSDSDGVQRVALAAVRQKPRIFLSSSAVGIYGDRGDEILTETSAPGADFLSSVAIEWEAEASRAEESGIRTVILRFGVILAREGGALPKMIMPFRLGIGGRLGSGKQWMSWVSLEDVVGATRAALNDENMKGPVNVVAPNPVRNEEFTRVLAQVLLRPAILPAPAFALRLALGEMADALLLSSQRVQPAQLQKQNHQFLHTDLSIALAAILQPNVPL